MASKVKKLDRMLRVRTLQLDLIRADEARARARFDQEEALARRIDGLVANVAPNLQDATAASLMATAHYRERLQQNAQAVRQRVAQAERGLDFAQAATREAKRDQSAIEKLIAREQVIETLKELRALEDLPSTKRKRHDIC